MFSTSNANFQVVTLLGSIWVSFESLSLFENTVFTMPFVAFMSAWWKLRSEATSPSMTLIGGKEGWAGELRILHDGLGGIGTETNLLFEAKDGLMSLE